MDTLVGTSTVLQLLNDSDGDDDLVCFHMRWSREDEDEALAAAVPQRGVSRANRRPNKARNFEEGFQRIMRDYFDQSQVYDEVDFEKRFRMPRTVLNRVYKRVPTCAFFVRKLDALGTPGIHRLQRITAALRMMAYGVAADAVDEHCRLSASSAMESLKEFTKGVVEEFGAEYLRITTAMDLERLLRINAARGFPGMVESIDCQHYECKSCPTSLAGAHKEKSCKPTLVLEVIADGEGCLWFMYFGLPGSVNEINVLNKSPTMGKILSASFPQRMEHIINNRSRDLLYFLADEIYSDYAGFVKNIANGGNTAKDKNFARAQEAVRKDFERAFGIIIARWHILDRPIKLWHKEDIGILVHACVVLYNMVVEARRDEYNSGMCDLFFADEPAVQSVSSANMLCDDNNIMPSDSGETETWAQPVAERYQEVMNDIENHRLKVDLIDHI